MGPTKVIIDHENLRHNYRLIKNLVQPAKILSVMKANAYGHGANEVSKTLLDIGTDYLGVAYPEEGIDLRKNGIEIPILLFGVHLENTFEQIVEHDIEITLTKITQLAPLRDVCKKLNKKAKIHIKVDTGMNRVGFRIDEYKEATEQIFSEPLFDVVGVYSHFSSSDEANPEYTKTQLQRFEGIKSFITNKYSDKVLFHIANSGAIMQLRESYLDMVRPGAMLYGYPPDRGFDLNHDIREVMSFVSKVALVKQITKGEPISYGRRFYTDKDTHIAVIPVGYADGYNRRFTNTGQVLIRGKRYPIAGAVCMDQLLVDIGNNAQIIEGDDVVLLGRQNGAYISNTELCGILDTIPYELTCWISRRVQRVHINF